MEFNNRLYELRKQKGFSQEELANRLNVSRQTVSKWELGETLPDIENLKKMAILFNFSIDEVLGLVAEKADESDVDENDDDDDSDDWLWFKCYYKST